LGVAQAADISGAAPPSLPDLCEVADAYKKETGVGLNYQSIAQRRASSMIKAKTVTFGASDMPLNLRI